MRKEVKYIYLDLENCEHITIGIKDVEYLYIDGITESNSISEGVTKLEKTRCCESFYLCLNKRINTKFESLSELSEDTVFKRLMSGKDIVSISYLDDSKNEIDNIFVPYVHATDDFEDCANKYQHSKINRRGNLLIVIKRKRKLGDL